MRAMVIEAPGYPLALSEVALPVPSRDEVRVRVVATAVNRADLLQALGAYPAPPGVPANIPGLEFSGVVDADGAGANLFKVGDPVVGIVGGGSYAEFLVAHERAISPAPKSLSLIDAAALPEALVTAYDAMVLQGGLKSGEHLLVHAAASGVGTAAVQLGRALGAHVIATSRSQEKLSRLAALGADESVLPTDGKFAAEVKARTGGRGADVIIDLVGGAYLEEDLRAAALRGRILLVGLTGGRSATPDLAELLRRRLTVIGTVLRSRPLEEKISLAQAFTVNLLPLIERGLIRPVIDRVFPLEKANDAHALVASNATFGKVLLTVSPPPSGTT